MKNMLLKGLVGILLTVSLLTYGVSALELPDETPPEFEGALSVSQIENTEHFRVTKLNADGSYSYAVIDKDGRLLVDFGLWDDISFARYGLLPVEKDGNWGLVDEQYRLVVDCLWDNIWYASDGLRPVKKDGKWGLLDEQYRLVVDCIYSSISNYKDGLWSVGKDGMFFYIDGTGKAVSPESKGSVLYEGRREDTAIFMIDIGEGHRRGATEMTTGKTIVPYEWDGLFFLPGGNFLGQRGELCYEIDPGGNITPVPVGGRVLWVDPDGIICAAEQFTVDYTPTTVDESGKGALIYKMKLLDSGYRELLGPVVETGLGHRPIEFQDDSFAVVKLCGEAWSGDAKYGYYSDGKYGVINKAGGFVLQAEYDAIRYLGYGKFLAKKNQSISVLGADGQLIEEKGAGDMEMVLNGLRKTVSDWAYDEVLAARDEGLLPEEYGGCFQYPVSRQEFCKLTLRLYSRLGGELPDVSGVEVFKDTKDEDVLAARALGIAEGKGGGLFAPFDSITRQEAAAMLHRLSGLLGISEGSGSDLRFADDQMIADWAREDVYAMENMGIMSGVGEGRFDPLAPYTKEQTAATLVRLLRAE